MQAEVPGGVHVLKLLQVTPDGTIPENIAKVNIIILQHVTSGVEALCWFFLVLIALLSNSFCLFLLLIVLFLFLFSVFFLTSLGTRKTKRRK